MKIWIRFGVVGLCLWGGSVDAVVLCARQKDGTFNTAVKIREACKTHETQLDPGALGLQGPPGLDGVPGVQGPQGVQGSQGVQGLPGTPASVPDISARVTRTADVAVPSDVLVTLTFDVERWDTANLHDPATPSRLTAPVAGTYQIDCQGAWKTNGLGWRNIGLWLNGSLMIAVDTENGSAEHFTQHAASTQFRLMAGDYVECGVSQYPVPSAVLAANPPGLASTLEFSMTLSH